MVGSINAPTSGNTFDKFVAAAKAIAGNEVTVSPHILTAAIPVAKASDIQESDSGPVTGGVGAVATAAPAAGTSAPSGSGGNGAVGAKSVYGAAVAVVVGAVALGLSL